MVELQYEKLHEGSCAMKVDATQHSQKVTVRVTVHDLIARRRLRGVGGRHLRLKYLKICHQTSINDQILGGMIGFELKNPYKSCMLGH